MRKENLLKKKLKQGGIVFGPWCVLPSPSIVNIIGAAGMDFVIIDLEHGVASSETQEEMIRSAESENCCPLVRVGRREELDILQSLDLGAHGVLVPHVSNKKEAMEVVAYTKYCPDGVRGFSPYTRAGGYGMFDIKDHTFKENNETLTAIILEGKEGVDSLEEILNVPNIDIIYIGAYDLSQDLGIPGQVHHKDVKKILEQCVRRIRDKGVAVGGHVARNIEDVRWMVEMGMQFITCLPDVAMISRVFQTCADEFKQFMKDREE